MKHSRPALLAALMFGNTTFAQVSATDPKDLAGIPDTFLPTAKTLNFANRGTPAGYTPDPDPRNFTSAYVANPEMPPGPPPGEGSPPASGPPPGDFGGSPGGAPASACIPGFGIGAEAIHLVSSPGRLTFVAEDNHQIRRIYIGGVNQANTKPTYSGDSIGHWEGNTLVVDTTGIKSRPGIHLVERWTKLPNGSIEIKSINFDAQNKPLGAQSTVTLIWRPDLMFVEDICEDFGEAFGPDYGK